MYNIPPPRTRRMQEQPRDVTVAAFQLGGCSASMHSLTASLKAEYGTLAKASTQALTSFDNEKELCVAERAVLNGLGFDCGVLPPLRDVRKSDVDGLHMGKHANTAAANRIATRVTDLDNRTLDAIVPILIEEMNGRFDDNGVMARNHVRANLVLSLHVEDYHRFVADVAPIVDITNVFSGVDIIACFELSPTESAVNGLVLWDPPQGADDHNRIGIASSSRIQFVSSSAVYEIALERFCTQSDLEDTVARSIVTRCKGFRFAACVCPAHSVAIVAWHAKYVNLCPAEYSSGYAGFCATFGMCLLQALYDVVLTCELKLSIPYERCRLIGDFNLQTQSMGYAAANVAAKLNGTLFNSGTLSSGVSPPHLELTAFGRQRTVLQEQVSKAGKLREKPSMCVIAPMGAQGNSYLAVSVDSTPCVAWPWDHVAIITVVQSRRESGGVQHSVSGVIAVIILFIVWFLVIASMQ